jgi:hypothetical protein
MPKQAQIADTVKVSREPARLHPDLRKTQCFVTCKAKRFYGHEIADQLPPEANPELIM